MADSNSNTSDNTGNRRKIPQKSQIISDDFYISSSQTQKIHQIFNSQRQKQLVGQKRSSISRNAFNLLQRRFTSLIKVTLLGKRLWNEFYFIRFLYNCFVEAKFNSCKLWLHLLSKKGAGQWHRDWLLCGPGAIWCGSPCRLIKCN